MKKEFSEHLVEKLKDVKACRVSERTGISEDKISRYKNKKKLPSFKNGIKLMQELKIKANEIEVE